MRRKKEEIIEENPSPVIQDSFISGIKPRHSNSYTPILVVLLLVAAYLLGVLTTKVQYLEKSGGLAQNTNNAQFARAQANQPAQNGAAAAPVKADVAIGHLPAVGNENAKVKLVEFSDFQCPFCKQFYDQTLSQIKKDYVDTGKVVLYYRHFPLSFHPAAEPAAEASECANDQGKFWEFHDEVFKNQNKISDGNADNTKTALRGFAQDLGLDMNEFNSCFDSNKHKDTISKDQSDGTAAGVSGTPSFYINGTQLVGAQPYTAFKAQIDKALQ